MIFEYIYLNIYYNNMIMKSKKCKKSDFIIKKSIYISISKLQFLSKLFIYNYNSIQFT